MRKEVKFENDSELKDFQEYDENKLAIAKICVLSTAPNSHQLNISEEVLRRDIGTIRGNFLVADMMYGDATTHTPNEVPVGYFLPNEDIEFEEVEKDGMKIVKAWAYAVLSKRYATAAYEMFVQDNHRATSIEMTVETPEDDEHKVLSFNAFGSTILGKTVAPSCKDAEMSLVRFAEEANNFFDKKRDSINSLKKFVEERKKKMAEQEKLVSHPIDTSKEAMYDGEWDGQKAKQDLVKEKNFKTLASKVCMKLEPGWEDREVTKLGYPVMMLHDGKWVYAVKGLSSALGYAKKEDETEVINKVEKIYKKLGLDSNRKEDDAKMAEIKFAAVDIGDMWGKVFDALHAKYPDGDWGSVYRIEGIYEESNKKFAIIRRKDEDTKYRLDFSLTEEGLTLADEIVKVELEIVETEEVRKFAEPEDVDKYKKFEDEDDKDPDDDHDDDSDDDDEDFAKKCAEMEKKIEERDNIIMENEKKMKEMEEELADLREFKKTCMEKDKACAVESVMNEVKDFMNDEQFKALRDEGMACEFAQIDAWTNKVKAISFESVKGNKKSKGANVMKFSAPVDNINNKSGSVWDRLKNL